ncbi:MAG: hypothetical protein AAF907_12405, partial [Planctomycetota bacterium]
MHRFADPHASSARQPADWEDVESEDDSAGVGIAEDRRLRILQRFVSCGVALAVAAAILLANGCEKEAEDVAAPTVADPPPADVDLTSIAPLPAPLD